MTYMRNLMIRRYTSVLPHMSIEVLGVGGDKLAACDVAGEFPFLAGRGGLRGHPCDRLGGGAAANRLVRLVHCRRG